MAIKIHKIRPSFTNSTLDHTSNYKYWGGYYILRMVGLYANDAFPTSDLSSITMHHYRLAIGYYGT